MAQFLLMFVLGLGLILFPQNTFAQGEEGHDHMGHSHMESSAPVEQVVVPADSALEEVGNPACPISGEKIGAMGETVKYEYNGKIYNLCCPMCKKDFDKDPEKFSKKAEEQMMEEGSAE